VLGVVEGDVEDWTGVYERMDCVVVVGAWRKKGGCFVGMITFEEWVYWEVVGVFTSICQSAQLIDSCLWVLW